MRPITRALVFAAMLAAASCKGNINNDTLHLATTTRVSLDENGGQSPDDCHYPSMSGDGRYIAFSTLAPLMATDTNSTTDVYVRDLQNGTIELASLTSTDALGDGFSFLPVLSGDGRRVVFISAATNQVPGDTNGVDDIFVRDLDAGTTVRVSVSSAGVEANASSSGPAISRDGRFVGFSSSAATLVAADTNAQSDVFVHELATSTTTRVNVDSAGAQATGGTGAISPAFSTDGSFVTFSSGQTNLVAGDTNATDDIFVRDWTAGSPTTTRVSVSTAGTQTLNGQSSLNPAMSGDGRYVAFVSNATNLVAGDFNNMSDIFIRDRNANTTVRVSVDSDGFEATGGIAVTRPRLSVDGSIVFFTTSAGNLVPDDENQSVDAFVRNWQAASPVTRRVSLKTFGAEGGGVSDITITDDGVRIAFESDASTYVDGDDNSKSDIFVREPLF